MKDYKITFSQGHYTVIEANDILEALQLINFQIIDVIKAELYEDFPNITNDNTAPHVEQTEQQPELKYLQDMTEADYISIFKSKDGFHNITSFKSLHGWATGVANYGRFTSWDTAKELGYDVNFILPIKK